MFMLKSNRFHFSLSKLLHRTTYDLIVIGGGSGGLACAQESAALGMKVALLDYVEPTPKGVKWNIGGTCVNVGCLPKKMMHQAGNYMSHVNLNYLGISNQMKFDWNGMVENIQNTIHSLNFSYKNILRSQHVKYINGKGTFIDPHHIEVENRDKELETLEADKFVIAVGLRPKYPNIPGAKEYGITSDDLFSLSYPPNKTLIIGASYIACETAGLLNSFGYDTTMMVRSILLRGFDRDMVNYLEKDLRSRGIKMVNDVPVKIEKEGNKVVVYSKTTKAEYDTVLYAIGREPSGNLHLEKCGIQVDPGTHKIIAPEDVTTCPNIYAIGDIVQGRPELTPTAIQSGKYLAHRLFRSDTRYINYSIVPTCVFTPLEYASVGVSEEQAIDQYGYHNIDIFQQEYTTIEQQNSHSPPNFAKLIIDTPTDKVIGLHIISPNASEIIQGYSVAMSKGMTKEDLDNSTALHPTAAENILKFTYSKKNPGEFRVTNC